MNSSPLSDRERAGLRGPVKTIVDDYSTTVFDRNGKTLTWRGNTSRGPLERTYIYDEKERLVRVTGSDGDHYDEFRYDDRGNTQIRHIPARPDNKNVALGISILFDATSEGEVLIDGGTVEAAYNERDQPVERRVFDDQGTLLSRIEYLYNANGQLSNERLISENAALPKAFRDQIPNEQRAAMLAEVKKVVQEMAQRSRSFGNAERTYAYNERGQVAERHMRMGSNRDDLAFSYNEHGDISEFTMEMSSLPDATRCRRGYEYDSFGNWTSMTETSEFAGNVTTLTQIRQLTYHEGTAE